MTTSLLRPFEVGTCALLAALAACSDGSGPGTGPEVDGAVVAIDAGHDAATDAPFGAEPLPLVSGDFIGTYRVPVEPALEAAAIFPVGHVEWLVVDGMVTLHYDLPVGLVGGVLDVDFVGPIAAGDRVAHLTSVNGTGTCTAVGTVISCLERFANLGPLPISTALVEQTAALEYAGPVADRTRVAMLFGGEDPIGIVEFDITHPAPDDGGGGGGGGHP